MSSQNAAQEVRSDARGGRSGLGRAHGKAILLGEHAVVYGAPAIAVPVPQLTVTANTALLPCPPDGEKDVGEVSFTGTGPASESVTGWANEGLHRLVAEFHQRVGVTGQPPLSVHVDSAIPPARGLGSSAAYARAVVLALADLHGHRLAADTVFDLIQAAENVAHGRSSGIDAVATGAPAPLLFTTGSGGTGQPVPIGFDGQLVIGDSGTAGSTREAVEMLRDRFEREPATRDAFVGRITELTRAAVRDLADGRPGDLGERLTGCHQVLSEVGLSTDRIDVMVKAALAAGGLGAKISGGGLGGCMIALADAPERAREVARALREAGAAHTWTVPLPRAAGGAG